MFKTIRMSNSKLVNKEENNPRNVPEIKNNNLLYAINFVFVQIFSFIFNPSHPKLFIWMKKKFLFVCIQVEIII